MPAPTNSERILDLEESVRDLTSRIDLLDASIRRLEEETRRIGPVQELATKSDFRLGGVEKSLDQLKELRDALSKLEKDLAVQVQKLDHVNQLFKIVGSFSFVLISGFILPILVSIVTSYVSSQFAKPTDPTPAQTSIKK